MDIPSSKKRIQSEAMAFNAAGSEGTMTDQGGTINWLIDNKELVVVELTGTSTFQVPDGVDNIVGIMVSGGGGAGGGGGGHGGSVAANYSSGAGGGGGGAGHMRSFNMKVTPLQVISYSCGVGGAGGAGGAGDVAGSPGAAGGRTNFGTLYSPGGQPGLGGAKGFEVPSFPSAIGQHVLGGAGGSNHDSYSTGGTPGGENADGSLNAYVSPGSIGKDFGGGAGGRNGIGGGSIVRVGYAGGSANYGNGAAGGNGGLHAGSADQPNGGGGGGGSNSSLGTGGVGGAGEGWSGGGAVAGASATGFGAGGGGGGAGTGGFGYAGPGSAGGAGTAGKILVSYVPV